MLFEVQTNLLTLIEVDCDDDCVVNSFEISLAVIAVGIGLKNGAARRARNSCSDNFRMNTGYGRYGATYSMVGFHCFNEELPCV
jgi:hypothetical protein